MKADTAARLNKLACSHHAIEIHWGTESSLIQTLYFDEGKYVDAAMTALEKARGPRKIVYKLREKIMNEVKL